MDTNAFILRRESLQARLEQERAEFRAAAKRGSSWWMSLPLVPLAGFLAAKSLSPKRHPVAKGFLLGIARRMAGTAARRFGLDGLAQPNLVKRVLSYL